MARLRDRLPHLVPPVAIFALALLLRLHPWAPGWGIRAGRYDDAAYFATAIGWVSGRLPYRDMVLIQPPGLVELLAPFALVGAVVGDSVAFLAAQLAWNLMGAATAAACLMIGRRHSPMAGWVAGLAYAAFPGALYADYSISLETPAAFATAVAFWFLLKTEPTRADFAYAGIALGVAVSIKIIWVTVIAWVLMWALWRHRPQAGALMAAGVGTTVAMCGVFFALAPEPMWRMVIVDQVSRPTRESALVVRIWRVAGIQDAPQHSPVVVTAALVATVMVVVWRCVRIRQYLPAGATVAALIALVAAPTAYPQYPALLAVPFAVSAGYAVPRGRLRWPALAAAAAIAYLGATVYLLGSYPGGPVPGGVRAAVSAAAGCVTTDNPAVLIAADAATRAARSGCPYWPDVTGVAYDEVGGAIRAGMPWIPREERPGWQSSLLRYLDAGTVIVLDRGSTGLGEDTRARLENDRTVTRVGRFTVMTS